MNVTFSDEELAFRDEVRTAFQEEFPEDLRRMQDAGVELGREDLVQFQKWLYERGFKTACWPLSANNPISGGPSGYRSSAQ